MMNNHIAITSYKHIPLVNKPIIEIAQTNYWIKHYEQCCDPRPTAGCSSEGLASLQSQEKRVGASLSP